MKTLLLLSALFWLACSAPAQPVVKNLVFEGAGMRGLAYCGAIQQLEQQGVLPQVQRVGGTSAGAITALAVALGYTGKEIETLIGQTNFKKFNDGKWMLFGGIRRFKKYYGWYRHKSFRQWLDKLVAAKTGNAEITFAELKTAGRFRELFITGTCLSQQRLMVFSHESFPNMKIRDAVTISMSIPLYFEAIFMNDAGQLVDHPKDKTGLHVMADGGFVANFPIRLFDSSRYVQPFTTENRYMNNPETIGFRIDREEQVARDQHDHQLAAFEMRSYKDYFRAFYTMIAENLNRHDLTDDDWKRTVSISDGAIGPKIRKLKTEEIERLIGNGLAATAAYFTPKP
jgi:NTE family protein